MGTADESFPEKTRCNVSLHTPAGTVHIHIRCNTDSIKVQDACVVAHSGSVEGGVVTVTSD